jgi:hypothetical protein
MFFAKNVLLFKIDRNKTIELRNKQAVKARLVDQFQHESRSTTTNYSLLNRLRFPIWNYSQTNLQPKGMP